MKVRAPVEKLCRNYEIAKRNGVIRTIYNAEPKHEQRQG